VDLDERVDLDGLGSRERHLAELLVRDRDDGALGDLIALPDLARRHLTVFDLADLPYPHMGPEWQQILG
jgi:hypothetical protein